MKILLIEDEKKLASYLKKGLEEESYSVDLAYDGIHGLFMGQENSYEIIILDIMLPGIDGFRVCNDLRAKGVLTPIIMLTAKDSVEDRIRGLDIGADDYLSKPFSFSELLARIRSLLRRNTYYKTKTLKVADLELDPVSHRVTRSGKTIELTGKEYALLELLMRNRGIILTESRIIESVWDKQEDTFTNVVNVYVHYLRNKIDKGFDKKLIHTVRSRGYILKDDSDD